VKTPGFHRGTVADCSWEYSDERDECDAANIAGEPLEDFGQFGNTELPSSATFIGSQDP